MTAATRTAAWVLLQGAVVVVAVAALLVVANGMRPVVPALGSVLRGLLNPIVLIALAAALLLARLGMTRRRDRAK